jgi:predicted kinase
MLYLIRGLPGSGKTTLSETLMNNNMIDVFFEADQYFYLNGHGVYRYDPSLIKDAHAWCQTCTFNALNSGSRVAVSNTFVRRWEMEPYLEFCREAQIPLRICVCEGYWSSIHAPHNVIESMRERWED